MDLRGFSSKWSASYQKLVSGLFSHRPCRSVPRWQRCKDQIERISFHTGSEGTLHVPVNTFDLEENANHSLFLIKKDSRSVTPKQPSGPRNLEGWFSGRSRTPPRHSNNQLLLPSGPLSSWKDGKYGQHLDTGQLHVHVPSQPPLSPGLLVVTGVQLLAAHPLPSPENTATGNPVMARSPLRQKSSILYSRSELFRFTENLRGIS